MTTRRLRELDLTAADSELRGRFWSKVHHVPGDDACWTWTAYRQASGYGMFTLSKGVFVGAHRISYALSKGPVAAGMVVRHRCDNPPCVRPEHLEIGSHRDNAMDAITRGRANRSHGLGHRDAKLTPQAVVAIRLAKYHYGLYAELAERYGVSATAIKRARTSMTWKSVGAS